MPPRCHRAGSGSRLTESSLPLIAEARSPTARGSSFKSKFGLCGMGSWGERATRSTCVLRVIQSWLRHLLMQGRGQLGFTSPNLKFPHLENGGHNSTASQNSGEDYLRSCMEGAQLAWLPSCLGGWSTVLSLITSPEAPLRGLVVLRRPALQPGILAMTELEPAQQQLQEVTKRMTSLPQR